MRTKTTLKSGAGNNITEDRFENSRGELTLLRRKREGASDYHKNQAYDYDTNGNRIEDERGDHAFNARDQQVWWKRGPKHNEPGTEVTYELTATGATDKKIDTALPGTGTDREIDYQYNGTRLEKVVDKDVTSDTATTTSGRSPGSNRP